MLSKNLGMDIWVSLLMVFLVASCVLMINVRNEGIKMELVRVQLSQGESDGDQADGVPEYVILSVQKSAEGDQLFLDNKPVARSRLKQALTQHREKGKTVLITRFDQALSHGEYIAIVDIAKQAGIKNVYDAYEKKQGGKK